MSEHLVATRDRRRLRTQQWGNPAGAVVFLLHGTPGSRLGPKPRDALLYRQGIRLITYDRPGYGDSDRLPGRLVAHAADDVADIADFFGIDRFSVIGRSGGGPHALACAAMLPARVRRAAALVSLAPFDAEGLDWMAGMTPSNVDLYTAARRGTGEMADRLEQTAALVLADPTARMPFEDKDLPESDRMVIADYGIKEMLVSNFHEGLRRSTSGWLDDSLSFLEPWGFSLADICVPVLLWHGEEDIFSPVSHTQWLAKHIPHADVSIESGAAHFGSVAVLPGMLRRLVADGPAAMAA
ncbi:MAG TPA: alpha/beta hydrolase [Actinocrinis sp.]|nr:alpha/beta hydrolase [Actinocrinis sp.]